MGITLLDKAVIEGGKRVNASREARAHEVACLNRISKASDLDIYLSQRVADISLFTQLDVVGDVIIEFLGHTAVNLDVLIIIHSGVQHGHHEGVVHVIGQPVPILFGNREPQLLALREWTINVTH